MVSTSLLKPLSDGFIFWAKSLEEGSGGTGGTGSTAGRNRFHMRISETTRGCGYNISDTDFVGFHLVHFARICAFERTNEGPLIL
jgi:hypothetical protein